jgi:hypothetical protein
MDTRDGILKEVFNLHIRCLHFVDSFLRKARDLACNWNPYSTLCFHEIFVCPIDRNRCIGPRYVIECMLQVAKKFFIFNEKCL